MAMSTQRKTLDALKRDKLDAETAERWGLIWKVVDDAQLMTEARKLAAEEWNRRPLFDAAVRALEAWDSTVLPRSHDGMMQERMEELRAALGPNVGAKLTARRRGSA